MTLHDAVAYLAMRYFADAPPRAWLPHGKLQRLLYYCQAWHLAIEHHPLFPGKFEAWVFGPVNREVADWFAAANRGTMYSPLDNVVLDVVKRNGPLDVDSLAASERAIIDETLDVYAGYSMTQLSDLSRREDPWIDARGNTPPSERSGNVICEIEMGAYYRQRISADQE